MDFLSMFLLYLPNFAHNFDLTFYKNYKKAKKNK